MPATVTVRRYREIEYTNSIILYEWPGNGCIILKRSAFSHSHQVKPLPPAPEVVVYVPLGEVWGVVYDNHHTGFPQGDVYSRTYEKNVCMRWHAAGHVRALTTLSGGGQMLLHTYLLGRYFKANSLDKMAQNWRTVWTKSNLLTVN